MYYVPYTADYMFLDDDELENQATTLEWRKPVATNIQSLFQSPKEKPEFPKAFQTYRSKHYETLFPLLPARAVTPLVLSTCIIDSDDDYPYAPPTP